MPKVHKYYNKKYFLILIAIVVTNCIHFVNKDEIQFIEKYGDEDFSDYYCSRVSLRGVDNYNDYIINYYKYFRDTVSYTIHIDVETKEISRIEDKISFRDISKDSVDIIGLQLLIKRFLDYKIRYLRVDSLYGVLINIDDFESGDLLRINNVDEDDEKLQKAWKKIEGTKNWYDRKY